MLLSLAVLQCSLLAPAWEFLGCYSGAKAGTRLSLPRACAPGDSPGGATTPGTDSPGVTLLGTPEIPALALCICFLSSYLRSGCHVSKLLCLKTPAQAPPEQWPCCPACPLPANAQEIFPLLASWQKHTEVFRVPSHQRSPELSPTILSISKAKVSGTV